MGRFLNSLLPFEGYKDIVRTRFFVDKSLLIEEIISAVTVDGQRYFCITRPRRFGKTVMAKGGSFATMSQSDTASKEAAII